MKRKLWSSMLVCFAIIIGMSSFIYAQETTGTIIGTVKDSSGAAVAGATINVTDPAKGGAVARTLTTSDDGSFTVPNLPVANYTVTVEAPNFKRLVKTDVKVEVGQRRPLDVTLEAGNIAETVTVTADQVAVELTTPTASTTITGNQVREISINNRNWIQLVTLAPGVSSNLSDQVYVGNFNPEGQANTVSISVNGARSSQNTFTVDGADITDRGSNLTIQTYPSVDSIGEFKVLRSLYPAESGRSGGGQVNVVTRSGTDKFHGSLFEFVRNEKFNANSFFNNRNAPFGRDENGKARRNPFRYNNYGFTVGGPVYFLKFGERDPDDGWFGRMPRTYFFFSEEQRKDRRSVTLVGQVPSAGMRQGIFTTPICLNATAVTVGGVTTRTCGQVLQPGNPLSSLATISPVAQAYVNEIYNNVPLPTSGLVTLNAPFPYKSDFQQEIVKIDTSFTKDWTAYYRFQRDKIPTVEVNSIFGTPCNIPDVCQAAVSSPGRAHTFQTNYVISPKMIVEARYTQTYGAILLDNIGLISRDRSPIPVALPYQTGDARVPQISGHGITSILQAYPNYDNFSTKREIAGAFTWLFGDHITKFGASFSKYRKFENALGGTPQGAFSGFLNTTLASPLQQTVCTPTGTTTGATCSGNQSIEQSWANFLLGNNASFSQTKFDLTGDFRQRNVEAFAQDEWRIKRGLTLYYGVRYSFFGGPWDANGFLSNFDPELWDPAQAPTVRGNGTRVVGTGNFCNGIIVNTQNFVTGPPSYNCSPIRSPYGKFIYHSPKFNFAPRVGLAWDPFGKGTTVIRTGYGIYHEQVLIGTVEQQLGVNPPFQETISLSGRSLDAPVPPGNTAVVASDNPPNLIRGWEPDFQTPYMQHWSLDIQHTFDPKTIVSVGYYGSKGTNLIGLVDINNLPAGYAATRDCAVGTSTTPTRRCQLASSVPGEVVPFFTSTEELILDQIRPYRGWRNIQMTEPWFDSNYHSLQVSATRRFTGDSQVQVAYTWSKNLTNNQTDRSTAAQDRYNLDAEWARAQLDRRHILTINYVYELPWYSEQHGFVGKVLGGWQVSGIITHQTGLPFTVTYSGFDPAGLGLLGSSPAGNRAYVLHDPNANAPHTFDRWFDTGAFLLPPTPSSFAPIPGTASRAIINGPPTTRVDFTLSKNIRFSEDMRLQLRGEAFNLFNKTNFTTFGTAASTTSTFGIINGTRDPRVLQFGIKFYW